MVGAWLAIIATSGLFVVGMTWVMTAVMGAPLGPVLLASSLLAVCYVVLVGESMLLMRRRVFPRRDERLRSMALPGMLAVSMGAMWLWFAPPRSVLDSASFILYVVPALIMVVHYTRKAVHQLVRAGLTNPRNVADAVRLAEICAELDKPGMSARERFHVRMNHAAALIVTARAADPHRRLLEAYRLLMELYQSFSPGDDSGRRVMVAERLVDVAAVQNQFGEELVMCQQALDLLHEEVRKYPDVIGARLIWLVKRADFLSLQIDQDTRGSVETYDPDLERRRWVEIMDLLQEALSIAQRADRTELRFRYVSQLIEYIERTGDTSRLEGGIEHARTMITMITKIGRIHREALPMAQVLLAQLLEQRAVTREPPDSTALDEAERLLRQACATAPDAEQRAICWFFLAKLLRLRHEQFGGDPQAARRNLDACRTAEESVPAHSPHSAQLATLVGAWAAEQDAVEEAAYGFSSALTAARRLSTMGMVRSQKRLPLPGVGGIAAEAMYWQLRSGRPREAVVALETGRALVLTDMIEREMLVRRLGEYDPSLAAHYSRLTRQLARAELDEPAGLPTSRAPLANLHARLEQARAVRALRDEWEALAARLRRLPEFRALVTDPSYEQLQDAASRVPLLYLAAADRTGHALLVTAARDTPEVVELPDLTRAALDDAVEIYRDAVLGLSGASYDGGRWRKVLDDTLRWLHEVAMGPIAAELRLPGQVALVPVGPLTLLPLHAGHADPTGAGDITWTYTPNGRIVARHARLVAGRGSRARRILLALDEGPDGTALRMMPAVESAVRSLASHVTVLGPGQATREAVLAALQHHELYHFNCHGQADVDDPFAGHLKLADRPLTIRDLLRQRLPGRLAILSACETAMAHDDLPDEVVSLSSALLEAGVPGVIASMWKVDEMATFLLTARFYELWLKGRLSPPDALRQAQQWLRSSTVEQFDSYLRANGLGRWPRRYGARIATRKRSERIYRHPDYWAAFAYTGV